MLLLLLAREQIFTLEKAMYAELYRIAIMEGIRILYIYRRNCDKNVFLQIAIQL